MSDTTTTTAPTVTVTVELTEAELFVLRTCLHGAAQDAWVAHKSDVPEPMVNTLAHRLLGSHAHERRSDLLDGILDKLPTRTDVFGDHS